MTGIKEKFLIGVIVVSILYVCFLIYRTVQGDVISFSPEVQKEIHKNNCAGNKCL